MAGEGIRLGQALGRGPIAVDDVARAVHGGRDARPVASGPRRDREIRGGPHGRDRELSDDHRIVHLGQPVEAIPGHLEGRRGIAVPQRDLGRERAQVDDELGVGDAACLALGRVEVTSGRGRGPRSGSRGGRG